jgi:NOL1/NOP2/fmu family ribosome biogenesis protein
MTEHKFIKSSEKKEILRELNEQFGITELPYLFIESGKEKIRAFSGSLSKEEIIEIGKMANVEGVGIYFLKKEVTGIRPSFEALTILRNQITKNILDIDDKQMELWIRGYDLDLKVAEGVYAIRHDKDFIGCGKSNGKVIFNYVPKERRIKKPISNE